MKTYAKLTPEGTRDLLFEESDALGAVERQLGDLFLSRGYRKIVTPTVEFYDVFNRESAGTLPESLYTMTDNAGRLLVLRPDSTLPIARVAATRLRTARLPLRLYYNQSVFSRRPKLAGYSDETTQSGIELIGAGGLRADLEALTLAARVLERCGGADYQIEIGHAGYFQSLCDALDADGDTVSEIYACVESKNFVALGTVLDRLGDTPQTRAMRQLPQLFGDASVLQKAAEAAGLADGETHASLAYLADVYARLEKAGLAPHIILDLSLVQRTNYYTGLMFRGYLADSGEPVLAGGRYDRLIAEFGEDLPAVGFGVQTDLLARLKLRRGEQTPPEAPEALVFGETGCETAALETLEDLLCAGKRAENSVAQSLTEALADARARGVPVVYVTGENGVREVRV